MDEIERLRKKLDSYPSPSSYNRLAELERLNGQLDEAAELCRRCMHEFPRNGQAYVILAGINLSKGNREQAMDILRRGVAQDRRSYSGLRMLSDLYAEDGHYDASMQCLEQVLTFKRHDESVRRRLEEIRKIAQERGGQASDQAAAGHAPPLQATQTGRQESDAIDLSSVPVELTSRRYTRSADTRPPVAVPAAQPVATSSDGVLSGVCAEQGVRGAVVVDEHGRLLISQGFSDGRDDLLAALAADVTSAANEALDAAGHDTLQSWAIATAEEQVVVFKRDSPITLLLTAAPTAKLALLELRARQALIELGGAE